MEKGIVYGLSTRRPRPINVALLVCVIFEKNLVVSSSEYVMSPLLVDLMEDCLEVA